MDFVIVFFRDVLDGPLYIAVSIVCSILICSCIGYMGEKYLEEKKEGKEFASKHTSVDDKPLTAEEAKKVLQTATSQTAENGEAVAQAAADAAQSDAVAEQSPEGATEASEEEEAQINANDVYSIGGGKIEELLDDD